MNYSLTGVVAAPAAAATMLYFANPAAGPRRLKLFECQIGSHASPADQEARYAILRLNDENATPGGTALTPVALDEDAPAAVANGLQEPTGEPTYEADPMLEVPVNQRATYRWVAAPGKEFVATAAEDTGFGVRVEQQSAVFASTVVLQWEE